MINPYTEVDMCMGMTCPNCGWGWVTTNTEHILLDDQMYTLSIPGLEKPSMEIIRLVSKFLDCNYVEAKQKLQQDPVNLIFKATVIREIAQKLKELDIPFTITPDFTHSI